MYSLFFRHLESQSLFLEKMCHTHQLALFCWFNKFNKKLNHWKALHRSMCLNFSILAPQKIPRKTPAAWLWHCSNFPIGWPKTKARRIGYQPQSFKGLRGVAGEAGHLTYPLPDGLLQPVAGSAFEDEKPDPRTLDAKHVGMSNLLGELFVLKFHLFRWAQPSSAPLALTLNANRSRSRCAFGNSSIFRNIRASPWAPPAILRIPHLTCMSLLTFGFP